MKSNKSLNKKTIKQYNEAYEIAKLIANKRDDIFFVYGDDSGKRDIFFYRRKFMNQWGWVKYQDYDLDSDISDITGCGTTNALSKNVLRNLKVFLLEKIKNMKNK